MNKLTNASLIASMAFVAQTAYPEKDDATMKKDTACADMMKNDGTGGGAMKK